MTPSSAPGPEGQPVAAKQPALGLDGRAPRPPVVRLRGAVVRASAIGAGVLVAGALTWAFVIQPELRDAGRSRASAAEAPEGAGPVRPAERVTEQPASYDRLPPPRPGFPQTGPVTGETPPPTPAPARDAPDGSARAPAGPSAHQLAVRSPLLFDSVATPLAAVATPLAAVAMPPGSDAVELHPPVGTDDAVYSRHALTAPRSPYEVKAGTIAPAVLLTGIDTSRPGPVVAAVTEPVYDTVTGRHLLLPQGARLLGRHEGESAYGDRRAFIAWDRVILPNGKSLRLDAEPGVDSRGAVGLRGRVDRRLGALLTGVLASGAITTLGQIARDDDDRGGGGLWGDAGDAAAIEGARVGGRLIDRELEVRPAIRVAPGGRVRVLITRDLILEPFQP